MKPDSATADAKLVAAYREGLALAAIVVVHGENGAHVIANPDGIATTPEFAANLRWCRNADEAKRIAASANASLRRRAAEGDHLALAHDAVARAAERLRATLRTEKEIAAEAAIVIGRVVREFEQMRTAGDLREVNAAYRDYRLAASGRGERIVPYTQWMRGYLQNLVRQAAATLKNL